MVEATRLSKPDPDPTEATTSQLKDAIANLEGRIASRLDGMDKAIVLLQRTVDRSPTIAEVALSVKEQKELLQSESRALKELMDTKFTDRDLALIAALAAAKEAVGAQNTSNSIAIAKSDSSTVEALKQLQIIFQTNIAAATTQINDLKSRLDKGEGSGEGRRQGLSDTGAFILGAISLAALVASIVSLFVHVGAHP
jgi:hypothetical protein